MERPRRGSFDRDKGALLPANIYGEAARKSHFLCRCPDKEFPWPVNANGLFHLIGSYACLRDERANPEWSRAADLVAAECNHVRLKRNPEVIHSGEKRAMHAGFERCSRRPLFRGGTQRCFPSS